MPLVNIPSLPPAKAITLPGRGEMVIRHHQHSDSSRPTLLLLHGWTASADTQWFTVFDELAEHYSFVAVDHRGHGRGLRAVDTFSIEDCADDAVDVIRQLGIRSVVTVGYSMGGPISFATWQRHPEVVSGMVFMATSMEWATTMLERLRWTLGKVVSPLTRMALTPRTINFLMNRFVPPGHEMHTYNAWVAGEMRRNDPFLIHQAGQAIRRFDARSYAPLIDVPTSVLLTTKDKLVPPRKQRKLATSVQAEVIEVHGDHFVTSQDPAAFRVATRRAVESVVRRLPGA